MEVQTDCETFSSEAAGEVGILRLKKNFLLRTTDLAARDRILEYLDHFANSECIRTVVVFGAADSKGRQEYLEFHRQVCEEGLDSDFIHRMLNVMNQIVLKIVALDKIVVHANRGAVVPHFLSLALAADYTVFGDDALIQNPCLATGMIPKGGIVYFMARRFGKGRVLDLLLTDGELSAAQAASVGLADRVVAADQLEAEVLAVAKRFARAPAGMTWGIKKLISATCLDIGDYMEYENRIFLQALRRAQADLPAAKHTV